MEEKKISVRGGLLLILALALGMFARLWLFGSVPEGLNQDEAFAGYEAWALLNYGVDSSGHPWPVYLTAWGSGMNALESYLMLPFIAAFGLEVWVVRLPQLLASLASLWAAFCLGRRIGGERTALLFVFALAICPWHILLSRWGLESNLAPGFLLFGLCLFLKGLEDGRWLCLSALIYGLALYTYATIWAVMPVLISLELGYAWLMGKLRADRYLLAFVLILGLLALPLLLFLLINYGFMDEIVLSRFSIPKLLVMRSGEVSLSAIPENLRNMLRILLNRSDDLIWNSPRRFGFFYPLSLPFMLIGIGEGVRRLALSLKRREFSPAVALLIQLLAGLLLTAMIRVNVTRMNILLLPLALFGALGVDTLWRLAGRRIGYVVAAAYLALFISFQSYYFSDYREETASAFGYGLEETMDIALAHGERVYLGGGIYHSDVLFYSRLSPVRFRKSVEYYQYPAAYLSAKSFDRFSWDFDPAQPKDPGGAYILPASWDTGEYLRLGYTVERYGVYTVAYMQ